MSLSSTSWLLDTSLRASGVILPLVCLRPALRRWIGSRALAWLWLAVAARLLFPLPMTAPWTFPSLLPAPASAAALPHRFHISVALADAPATSHTATPSQRVSLPQTRSWMDVLALVWLLGTSLAAIRLARGWWTARCWSAHTLPADIHPGLASTYLTLPTKIRRGVELRLTDVLDVPTLVGVLHPQIWLPRTLPDTLTPAELHYVLLHELGHVRRHDLVAQWLCSLACCLHWFNPFVWLLARFARTDRELACDAWVLSRSASEDDPPASYGHTLLKVLAGICRQIPPALPLVPMAAGKRHLDLRVREIRAFRPLASWRGVLALAVTLVLMAAFTVRGTAAGSDPNSMVSTPPSAPASPSPVPVVPMPHTPDPLMLPPQVEIESKFIEMSKSGVLALEKSVPRESPIAGVVQQISEWYAMGPPLASAGIFRSSLVFPDNFQLLVRQLNQTEGIDLLSAPRVTTKSGQKATVEIISEFIYPTAYEREKDDAGRPRAIPTNFDKTNVGLTVEVNPTVASKRDIIDLSIGWKVTSFDGFVGEDGKPLPARNEGAGAKFPIFTTHSVNTVASLTSGSTVVFSTTGNQAGIRESFSPDPTQAKRDAAPKKANEDRLLLVFITARLVDPPPASPAGTGSTEDHPSATEAAGATGAAQSSQPTGSPASLPYGTVVPGKPGLATSPYAPDAGYVDLHGFTRGQSVRDPYTGKMFLVP